MPELVLSTLRRCWPNAHLSLAGLRVNTISNVLLLHMVISQGSGQPLPNGYPQNYKLLMHCRNLWSLAAIVNDGLESGLRRLKDVLVTNPNLKELHLAQRKVGMNIVSSFSRFSFMSEGNAKFPNLHRLELESFHFNSAGSRLWELSHLRHLELRNVQLNPFFDIVRAQDLKHLRVLRLEERCFAGASAPREKLADFLMNLPSGLECLSLSQVVGRIPISLMAITHGMTLRSLVLQESLAWMHTGMTSAGPDNPLEVCPMLSVADLNLLGMECSCLETLLLDMPRTTEWVSLGPDLCNSSLPCPQTFTRTDMSLSALRSPGRPRPSSNTALSDSIQRHQHKSPRPNHQSSPANPPSQQIHRPRSLPTSARRETRSPARKAAPQSRRVGAYPVQISGRVSASDGREMW